MIEDPRARSNLGPLSSLRWWRMTLKELQEILRDRRTILTLIGMPLLIYPLLGVTFQKLLVSQAVNKTKIEYRIAFATRRDSEIFHDLFQKYESIRNTHVELGDSAPRERAGTID